MGVVTVKSRRHVPLQCPARGNPWWRKHAQRLSLLRDEN